MAQVPILPYLFELLFEGDSYSSVSHIILDDKVVCDRRMMHCVVENIVSEQQNESSYYSPEVADNVWIVFCSVTRMFVTDSWLDRICDKWWFGDKKRQFYWLWTAVKATNKPKQSMSECSYVCQWHLQSTFLTWNQVQQGLERSLLNMRWAKRTPSSSAIQLHPL